MASQSGGRLWRLLYVVYFLEAGAFLTLAPWSRFWALRVVHRSPAMLRDLLASPFLRSFLVGIGVVHMAVAVLEIEAWRRETARRHAEASTRPTAAQSPP